jgi:hypothetical protein
MSVENPTGDDTGASITDRLESFLAAGDSPEEKKQPAQQAAAGSDADDDAQDLDANADTPVDPPEGDEQGNDEGSQLSTADLAKYLGIEESALDVDADGNAVIKTKIDGKDGAAKFSDMLKSYQLQGHVDNRARDVAAQQQALQQQAAHAEQAIRARLDQLDSVVGQANAELMREFQGIDWQHLRNTNQGEYAALLADFQARKANLDNAAARSQQERHELQAQQSQEAQAFIRQEHERLPNLIPEWKDAAVADKEKAEINAWALKNGFDPTELQSIGRASAVAALRKAMLYDRQQGSKAAIENKVRTAPKLVKAGQAPQVSRAQNTARTLHQNVRKSGGKTGDVAAFLLATGKA